MEMKYQIKIKSLNKKSLNLYKNFLLIILKKINTQYSLINLPCKKSRVTLLKSPHVNKSAREQFEIKYYSTLLHLETGLNNKMLKLLLINKPKTASISIKTL